VANEYLSPTVWGSSFTLAAMASGGVLAQIVNYSAEYIAPVDRDDYVSVRVRPNVAASSNLPDGQHWGSQKIEIDL